MADRWIDLDGTSNTRDLGGIPTSDGVVTDRVVIRSDNLQDLTPADVERLTGEIGVNLVIDLRTPGEVASEGPTPLVAAGVDTRVLSLLPDPDAAMRGEGRVLPDRRGMDPVEAYLGYLRDMPDNVVTAMRLIARADGVTVIHCAAGKDRTGVIAAMLLDLAGADRSAIIDDYVATGEVIGPLMARLLRQSTYAAELSDVDLDSHRPRERTMREFLDTLDREWGGAAGWLAGHGLDEDDLMGLRQRLSAGEITA